MMLPPTKVSRAGQDFNYETWTQGTQVTLANVPWGNDYRDVVDFTPEEMFYYLNDNSGPTTVINSLSYVRFGTPVSLPISFALASQYNYLRVINPLVPGDSTDTAPPKSYYYFITHVEMANPGTTRIYVQLDAWQTYGKRLKFGRAFVERGHLGIANINADFNNGRNYLTIPEGMDLGGEYLARGIYRTKLPGKDALHKCSVVAVSSVSFSGSGGDTSNPVLMSAQGGTVNSVPNGADIYFFQTPDDFMQFLIIHRDMPWVTQGIMAAYLIPPMKNSDFSTAVSTITTERGVASFINAGGTYDNTKRLTMIPAWRTVVENRLPERYRHLTKLMTYPYTFFELTMSNGMPLVVKPESLSPAETDFEVDVYSLITPPNPRMMISPHRYNDGGYNSPDGTVLGEWLDFATGITSLPQVSVVNNSYANYLASNNYGINFQHQSADWSQQRALRGADTAMQNAQTGIGAMGAQNSLSVSAVNQSMDLANQTAVYRGITSGVGDALSGGMKYAATGNGYAAAAGAAIGMSSAAANVAIETNQNTQQAGIQNRLSTGRTGVAMGASGTVADTNLGYAQFAASGDYANTIAGINAKVQDAKMIQPTISGQTGGDAFNFSILGGFEVHAKIKQIDDGVMRSVAEYWLRYGYAVNRFHQVAKLSLMARFTYWKMKELYIKPTVGCPETFRQTIRGIFESGVTVWKNPDDMATADIGDNAVTESVGI